jgi:hypothetical protein
VGGGISIIKAVTCLFFFQEILITSHNIKSNYPDNNFHPLSRFLRLLHMVPRSVRSAKAPMTVAKIIPADAACQSSQNISNVLD